jgi:hypothetical protein
MFVSSEFGAEGVVLHVHKPENRNRNVTEELFLLLLFSHVLRLVHFVLLPLFRLLYQPRVIHDDDCGAISGMRIDRGN